MKIPVKLLELKIEILLPCFLRFQHLPNAQTSRVFPKYQIHLKSKNKTINIQDGALLVINGVVAVITLRIIHGLING